MWFGSIHIHSQLINLKFKIPPCWLQVNQMPMWIWTFQKGHPLENNTWPTWKTWKPEKLENWFDSWVGQVSLISTKTTWTCKCCASISDSQTVSASLLQKTKQIQYHDVKTCMTSVHTGKHQFQCEKHVPNDHKLEVAFYYTSQGLQRLLSLAIQYSHIQTRKIATIQILGASHLWHCLELELCGWT